MEKTLINSINPDEKLSSKQDLNRKRTYGEKKKLYNFIINSKDGKSFLEKVGQGLIDDEKICVEKAIQRVKYILPYMRYSWEKAFVGEWYTYYVNKGYNKNKALELADRKLNEENYGIKAKDLFFIFLPESVGKFFARSKVGAKGLYQFMPKTARIYGLKTYKFDYRYDPLKSASAAGKMFAQLMIKGYDILTSTVTYNGGEGRTFKSKTYDEYFKKLGQICKRRGINHINIENLEYPGRFVAAIAYLQQKKPDIYGIEPLKFNTIEIKFDPNLFYSYKVKKGDTLWSIAKLYNPKNSISLLHLLKIMYDNKIKVGERLLIPRFVKEKLTNNLISFVKKKLSDLNFKLSKTQIDMLISLNNVQIWSAFISRTPINLIISYSFFNHSITKKETDKNEKNEKIFDDEVNRYKHEKINVPIPNLIRTKMIYENKKNHTLIYHKVLSKQTLYGIAANYGISINEIKRWNNLNSNIIHPGQTLVIKLKGKWKNVGRVKKGQTLFSIKIKYGKKAKVAVLGGSNIILPGQIIIKKISIYELKPKKKLFIFEKGLRNEDKLRYVDGYTYVNHIVKKGQTLYSIAKNYEIAVQNFIERGLNPHLLKPGDVINIKLRGRYILLGTVKQGDTLLKIKRRYKSYKIFILGYGWPFGRGLTQGMLIYGKRR